MSYLSRIIRPEVIARYYEEISISGEKITKELNLTIYEYLIIQNFSNGNCFSKNFFA